MQAGKEVQLLEDARACAIGPRVYCGRFKRGRDCQPRNMSRMLRCQASLTRKSIHGQEQLEAFSDGVIAILITIMVVELKVPHDPDFRALLPLWPVFMS